ncbi:LuxR family transcriptional regulator [Microbacterium capsulatum]|uniref:LuxR family transcriptional regulator n=1 Tax=Microbacterium capsulatum TaxID=3041921 RepID=A0ABU0XHX8_9MICO|nr:LuxR family transcriptional regulator [Microbacterium sp. ASV81]MDQ4214738.1 LuxR family transcriptional regulator [Microbacterium sp. ASV81]
MTEQTSVHALASRSPGPVARPSPAAMTTALPSLAVEDHPAAVLSEALAARTGMFAVTGPSGAGKSTWVRQLVDEARRPGAVRWRVVAAIAERERISTPYAVAGQLIRAAGARTDPGGEDAAAGARAGAPTLLGVAERMLSALLRGLSSRRRLLLVVDDAQWIDDASTHVLRLVLGRLAPTGVVVVLAGRDPATAALAESVVAVDRSAWCAHRRLPIDVLDAAGVRRYVSAVHGVEVSLDLAERIRRVSGGTPLLTDQVVAGIGPILAARAADGAERPARFDQDVTDADIARGFTAVNPFGELGADLPRPVQAIVEIAAVLGSPLREAELRRTAAILGETVDLAEAAAQSLLSTRDPAPEAGEEEREWTVFHDLYAADVVAHLGTRRRAQILAAGAEAVPGADESTRHRALMWRMEAAILCGEPLVGDLRARFDASVEESVRARRVEHVFAACRRGIGLAGTAQPELAGELVVGLYCAAVALSALPRMIEWIPQLEQAPTGPLRDLALLHVREFRGDYAWAREFADGLLLRLPRFPDVLPQSAEDVAAIAELLEPEALGGLVVRLQVVIVLGIMAPQARPGDFGMERFAEARAGAEWMIAVQHADPESWRAAWGRLDRRFEGLPSAHDVLMRSIGMQVFGLSAIGPAERVPIELAALSRAIAIAPAETATLFDALVIRAGMFSAVGYIGMAAADLAVCMRMLREGTGGWGTGTARALHIYCRHLLGDVDEVADALAEAAATMFDDMDAVGRPVLCALRAVRAAEAGDEDAWRADMEAVAQFAQRGYDTVGVEYELLAHIALARLHRDPEAQLAAFDPGGPLAGRLLRSQNLYAYKVDALAALGRAEEADRELARLKALPQPGFQPVYASIEWLEGRVHEAYGLTKRALRAYRAAADPEGPGERLPAVLAQAALDAGRLTLATGGGLSTARRHLRAAQQRFLGLGRPLAAAEATALIDATRHPVPAERAPDGSGHGSGSDSAEPRRMAGFESLTAREREVAGLAAAGRTNAEIAAALGVEEKTAAFHMGNVLHTLGLSSRRQLRGPVPSTGPGTAPGGAGDDPWAPLSRREREVAELAARELTDAEIADELGLSARTVGGHMGRVLAKLGLRSRRELRG